MKRIQASLPANGSYCELRDELWPIVKREPTYIRLGWALYREPAIKQRHKTLLYATALYTVTPAHLVLSPIPVLGQVDSIVLLLMGIQQAYAHCPPEVRAKHLARLKLAPTQMERDQRIALSLAKRAVGTVGRPVGRRLRFAGHVVTGFSRKMAKRMVGRPEARGTIHARIAEEA